MRAVPPDHFQECRGHIAEALVWAGESDEAVARARAAQDEMAAQDAFGATQVRPSLGVVLVAAGHREEALAFLREMMRSPCLQSPNALRIDPFWAPLKDDPRFEKILKAAEPL